MALDSELATVGTAEASNAASGVTAAFVASIGLVVGSGLLILLFTVYARRRRHTIAAGDATAAAFASERRIVATREETFRSLFDENPQAMMVTTLPSASTESGNLPFLAVNNAALTMYGYTRAEFLKLTLVEICLLYTSTGRESPVERDIQLAERPSAIVAVQANIAASHVVLRVPALPSAGDAHDNHHVRIAGLRS